MEFLTYKTETQLISPKSANLAVSVRAGCIDIAFVNLGTTVAFMNNIPILAGATLRISAQDGQFDDSIYQVQCDMPVGSYGLWVIRKLIAGKKEISL